MENQEKLIVEYLNIKLEETEEKIKEKKRKFGNIKKKITETRNEISNLEHEVDAAFEVFSPISMRQQIIKEEINRLMEEVEEENNEKEILKNEIKKLQNEADEVKEFLSQGKEGQIEGQIEEQIEKQTEKQIEGQVKIQTKSEGNILIEQQELERQRIARELHDTIVQNLTALIHKIDFCSQILNSDLIRVRLELEIIKQVIKDSINEIREIIYDLRPMTFDDMGIDDTLKQAVEQLQKGFDTKIVLETEGESYQVSQVIQLTILRIIQEAVNNCKKHAKAEMIDIMLTYQEDAIKLVIMDDGVGFDTSTLLIKREENTGFGLSMMRERICLLNGTFEIESKLGFGTEIQINIPIKDEVAFL